MKILLQSLLLLILAVPAMAASYRDDSFALRQTLQNHKGVDAYPEEYSSFRNTLAAAEQMLAADDAAGADDLFSLALLKGNLLLSRLNADRVPPLMAKQAFAVMSSSLPGQSSPALPESAALPQPDEDLPGEVAAAAPRISDRIVGGEGFYHVRKKESLKLVASRLGVRLRDLARLNRLQADATVIPGQKLRYNNRKIIPKTLANGIVINIPDRSLYLFKNGKVAANYPVALGIAKKTEGVDWQTPVGRFRLVDKTENPTWRVPPSIQKEMEERGEKVVEVVPPGPKNPLGRYAMRTTLAGILIHSTTRPSSINSYSSHGCIRVMPEHMELLYKSVSIPMQGEIVYQPVKVEVTRDGRVFLEVNKDYYEKIEDFTAEVKRLLKKHNADNRVSWNLVDRVVTQKSGIAEEVTLAATPD